MSKIQVVAVWPSGMEYFGEVDTSLLTRMERQYQRVVDDGIPHARIPNTTRKPRIVPVEVYKLEIQHGRQSRVLQGVYSATVPPCPMDQSEYDVRLTVILAELPEAFRGWAASEAYSRGYSGGYEEVLSIAEDMVSNLKCCLRNYDKGVV